MAEKKKSNNIIDFSVFRRPLLDDRSQTSDLVALVTFRNVVLILGVAALLIFLGSAVSARIAFLFAALLGLSGLVLFEMSSRRKWERQLMQQLQKMGTDYERIVRETARNRNDMQFVKKGLFDTGAIVRSQGKTKGEDVEQRMVRAIAEQLSKIGEPTKEEVDEERIVLAAPTGRALSDSKSGPPDEGVGHRLSDVQVLQLVNLAVQQDRIDLFLQPVVALPQRKLRFYEMFSRIRIKQGVYLPAERYIEVAMTQDLVPVIDNLLLLRGLQMIRDTEEENFNRAFFCNITSLTLNDPKFMGDLVEFIAQNKTLAPRLMFELCQTDLSTMSPDTLPVLAGLSTLGCRFSMDQVKTLSFDFAHLEARHIRFIKVDANLLVQEMKEVGGLSRMKRMKSELDRRGIDLIVEKIETEAQLLQLLDAEIDYGQGYLFGKPEHYKNV